MNDSLNNPNSQYINSIIRASEILNLYRILDVPSLGISEISRHLKLGKTTVFRIVKTLESIGWLIQDESDARYRIGPLFLLLSSISTQSLAPNDIILHEMRRLCKQFNEDIVLITLVENNAVCIEKLKSNNALKIASNVGRSIGMTRGATGKVLLAYLPPEQQDEIIQMEMPSITDSEKEALHKALSSIQENGYAFSTGEKDDGISAIAVPIIGKKDNILYSLSLVGESNRVAKKGISQIKNEMRKTAFYLENVLKAL